MALVVVVLRVARMNSYTWRTGILEMVMIAATAVFVFPLWLLISVGFRTSAEVTQNPLGAPTRLDLSNFKLAWEDGALGTAFLNSAYIAAVTIAALVVVGLAPAITSLARAAAAGDGTRSSPPA